MQKTSLSLAYNSIVRSLAILIAVVSVFNVFMTSCLAESTLPRSEFVGIQEVRNWIKHGREFLFVDVREPKEFSSGHLPGAANIPYYEIEDRREEIPLDRPVVIYCTHSSWRAPYAGNLLADYGMNNVKILDGGASSWNAGGQIIYASSPKEPEIIPKPKDLKKEFKYPVQRKYKTQIDLTEKQLREFDGKNGRPAYVAVHGVIYDVTQSRLWRGGEHDPSDGQGYAGYDLTELLDLSPHGDKYVVKFPVVGRLVENK